MVLFLIMAMVAGYTNRNLVFEQRVSANQYRATQAFEAAEAGLEWGLAMLNAGRLDNACQPVADPLSVAPSFRQRYLQIDANTGVVAVQTQAGGAPLHPACVFDGTAWNCSCPTAGAPVLAAPVGAGPFPAFRLQFFSDVGYPPGVARLEVVGCTRLDAADVCAPAAGSGDSRARVTMLVALKSGLTTPPGAGVTAREDLAVIGNGLLEVVPTVGVALHAGGNLNVAFGAATDLHGSPPVVGDLKLQALADDDRMFAAVFGMPRDTYRWQPGTIFVACAVDCSAARVRDLVRLNPGRMLWIDGDFDLDIADDIGTAALPALLVVDGTFTVDHPAAQVTGAVYAIDPAWSSTAGSDLVLRGGIVAESGLNLAGPGRFTVTHDSTVLTRLHATHGSFVRVPGSWKDF